MDKQIDKLIGHIKDLESRLGEVDNNLRSNWIICLEITKNCNVNTKQYI